MRLRIALDGLAGIIVLSLALQIAHYPDAGQFWSAWRHAPTLGFGSPLYFLTSAFIWLQGLFYFHALYEISYFKGGWINTAFVVFSVTIAGFFLMQVGLRQPAPYDAGAGYNAYSSPYEDIHSFGAIVVAIFGYVVASRPPRISRSDAPAILPTLVWVTWLILFLIMVAASWSRATWLACGVVLLLVCALRFRLRYLALAAAGVIALVLVLNTPFARAPNHPNPYLQRLASLARLENLASKNPARTFLYEKAYAMIRQHPWGGHGVGSFFLTSVRFARPEDPDGAMPNFAHNFLLQLAAELGAPGALLFASVVGFVLWRGFHTAPEPAAPSPRGVGRTAPRDPAVALVGYLVTQLTANALNVYVSNQFFFWLLVVAILAETNPHLPNASTSTQPMLEEKR